MHFGLTFVAIANQRDAGERWTQQRESLERHKRLTLSHSDHLTYDERRLLKELAEQVSSGELQESRRCCPECYRPFVLATVSGIELDCCPKCRGIWFDPGELQAFSHQEKEIPSDDKAHRPSRFRCPDCDAEMVEYTFVNPHSLMVDRCPNGHGVYLEDRELERVFEIV